MRPAASLTAALVAAVLALVLAAGAQARAPLQDVIVTLRAQAPASGAVAAERDLRRVASAAQQPVLRFLRRRAAQGRARVVRRFWVFDGIEVRADRGVIDELAALPGVVSVRRNEVIRAPAQPARAHGASMQMTLGGAAAIGASALWRRGITGTGVVIASLDSGVDGSSPALARSFRGRSHDWFDPSGEHPRRPTDLSGHGTWTMGVMVGSGAGDTPPGAAPGARWIAAKVFDDQGTSTTARIHAAFQWALDPDGDPDTPDAPQIVNSSWGVLGGGCDLEFEPDLRRLREAGVLPVFAAGNDGSDESPANNPSAFAVGAVDDSGRPAPGTGRGPSACGDPVYPRIVAPGVDVATTDLFGLTTVQSGTSMAAPYVSGALALLRSRFPGLSAQRQQAALESGAGDLGRRGPDTTFGYGRLDAGRAAAWIAGARDVALTPLRWTAGTRQGGSADFTVRLTPLHGFRGDVRVVVSGVPFRASAARTPVLVRGGRGHARLRVRTLRRIEPGTYPVTIRASGGGLERTVTTGLIVRSAG